ncbi:MAG: radical SAM protein [Methylococcales bacterium]|nr:radical SAM protein [Methylococcales bacterium]
MLRVTETFTSIQGESTFAGELCFFIRLTGCSLRCNYCDTQYAYGGGSDMSIEALVEQALDAQATIVEITGGEPLEQKRVVDLAQALLNEGLIVLMETSGSEDISVLPAGVIRIMDIKTPGSGEEDSLFLENLIHLTEIDEVKIVITSRDDYEWAKDFYINNDLPCQVIFSPSWGQGSSKELAEWIIEDRLPV